MKFWDMMKKFLSVDEEDYIPQSQLPSRAISRS